MKTFQITSTFDFEASSKKEADEMLVKEQKMISTGFSIASDLLRNAEIEEV